MAEILESEGTRVLKSVFEVCCTLPHAERLLTRLASERHTGDSIRMYCLTEVARARSAARGGAPVPERSEFWLL